VKSLQLSHAAAQFSLTFESLQNLSFTSLDFLISLHTLDWFSSMNVKFGVFLQHLPQDCAHAEATTFLGHRLFLRELGSRKLQSTFCLSPFGPTLKVRVRSSAQQVPHVILQLKRIPDFLH